MPVSRWQIFRRGAANRCPNCGGRTLFAGVFRMDAECRDCGLTFDRGEGFYLGSASINYSFTLIFCLVPVALLWHFEVLGGKVAAALAVAGALLCPLATYRSSRSWWLMFYYLALPHLLPANRAEGSGGGEEEDV